MKRIFYLVLSFIGIALLALPNRGLAQGSGIYGTTQVHSGGHMGIYGSLTFVNGYVVTPRNEPTANIYFTTGSSWTGASNASHVNGYAEKAGTTPFMFPIGNGTTLRMAGISGPVSGNYRGAYYSTNPNSATLPTGAPFPTANRATGVTGVSTVEYWDIDGASATNLSLTWDASSNLNALTGGNLSNLVIVGYSIGNNRWESLGNAGGTTGTLPTSGTITANGVLPDNYRAFTFGTTTCTLVAAITPTSLTVSQGGTISFATSTTGSTGTVNYAFTGPNGFAGTTANVSIPSATSANGGTYTVTVTDGSSCSATASVNVTVIGSVTVTSPPPLTVTSGTSATGTVGVTGGTGPYTYAVVSCSNGTVTTTSTSGGTVTVSSTGNYSYTPPTGFTGTDTFCIRACDSSTPQQCATGTYTVTVSAPPCPPYTLPTLSK